MLFFLLSAKEILPLRPAGQIQKGIKVLCFIPTAGGSLYTKGLAVRDTWSGRCDQHVFFSSQLDASFPTVKLNIQEGRDGLTSKTVQSLKYIYQHYFNATDWFLKADDDTYVIVEK